MDYAIFSFALLGAFAGLHVWMRRSGRAQRRPLWVWASVIALVAGGGFYTHYAGQEAARRIREMLEGLPPTYAAEIERLGHAGITAETGSANPTYLAIIAAEIRWEKVNPLIEDIYTLRRLSNGRYALIVDAETARVRTGKSEGNREPRAPIGQAFAENIPGLEPAFAGVPVFIEETTSHRRAASVSAFVPLHDAQGRVEAVLGVDYSAALWRSAIARARWNAMAAVLAFAAVLGAFGLVVVLLRTEIEQRTREKDHIDQVNLVRQAAILDALPAHIALLDAHGNILAVNEAWRRFGGANQLTSPDFGRGLNYLEICDRTLGPDSGDARQAARGIRSVLGGEANHFSFEYPCDSPTERRWFQLTVSPLAEAGRSGVVLMHLNITERRNAEEARLLLTNLIESSNDAIIGESLDRTILTWNRGAERIFGYTAAEMIGRTMAVLLPPDCTPEERVVCSQISQRDEVIGLETRRMRKDGTQIHVLATISPIKDACGRVVGFSKIGRDITERKKVEESLRLLSSAVEQSRESIVITDAGLDGTGPKIVFVNSAFTQLTGFTAAEAVGQTPRILQGPRSNPAHLSQLRETLERGDRFVIETVNYRKDRTEFAMEYQVTPVRNARGVITHFVALQHDITERKRAAEIMQERLRLQERLGKIAATAPGVIYSFRLRPDGTTCFPYASPTIVEIFGVRPEDLVEDGATIFRLLHPADLARVNASIAESARTISSWRDEFRVQHPTRGAIWVEARATPEREADGSVLWHGFVSDISPRKHAEQALRESEEQFRTMFDMASVGMAQADPHTARWLRVNSRMCAITGYTAEEMLRMSVSEVTHPEERELDWQYFQRVVRGEAGDYRMEKRYIRKDGAIAWVNVNVTIIRDAGGQPLVSMATIEDITERKGAELRLKLQHSVTAVLAENTINTGMNLKKLLATVCRQLHWGVGKVWVVDRAARVLRCAEVWRLSSPEVDTTTAPFPAATREIGQDLAGAVWASGKPEWCPDIALDARSELQGEVGDGELHSWVAFPIRLKAEVLGVVEFFATNMEPPDPETLEMLDSIGAKIGVFIERQQLSEQFRQAQKLESVGRLASGIAHEINTPAQFVNDNISYISKAMGDIEHLLVGHHDLVAWLESQGPLPTAAAAILTPLARINASTLRREVPAALADSIEGMARITKIVRAMKSYAHPGGDSLAPIDLNQAIESTLVVCRNEWRYVAELETHYDPALPPVPCLRSDFNQVILNLVVNAAQAIGSANAGHAGALGRITVTTTVAGPWAEVRIADTGTGIPDSVRPHIFEPFFTTKEVGLGTGQGLAMARSIIVDRHKGTLAFETQTNRGTTFIIRLPLQPA